MKLTMRRATLATVGVVAAGGLVLGGAEAFASAPASNTSVAASPAASVKSACKAAKHPRACAARRAARGRAGARLLERGVHGQATVKTADGSFTVREWQTGKVASIDGGTVTVTDASGTTWTWTVQPTTRYRIRSAEKGGTGSLADVHAGDRVFVVGVQQGDANDVTALADLTGAGEQS